MILNPFTVHSKGKNYTFTDRGLLDSEAQKLEVDSGIQVMLNLSQSDATCEACDIADPNQVGTMVFRVTDNSGAFTGIWMCAGLEYISGPWEDLVSWNETDPNATALFDCRPSPGIVLLDAADEADLAVEVAHELLFKTNNTTGGHKFKFQKMRWAIFKDRTDPVSQRANALHGKAAADNRLKLTETADPDIAGRTHAVLELK